MPLLRHHFGRRILPISLQSDRILARRIRLMERPGRRLAKIAGQHRPRHQEPRGRVVGEPRLPTGRDMDGHALPELHYQRYAGDLFVGRVSGSDVGQGDLGDCFFLASLAAFAKTDPDGVRRAITDNHDGTYSVSFWEPKDGGKDPLRISVEPSFPADANGIQVFGKASRTGRMGRSCGRHCSRRPSPLGGAATALSTRGATGARRSRSSPGRSPRGWYRIDMALGRSGGGSGMP